MRTGNVTRNLSLHDRYLKNKTKKETRIRFFNTVAVPVLMYGDEARVMTGADKAKITAAVMKFMRSCLLYTSRCV